MKIINENNEFFVVRDENGKSKLEKEIKEFNLVFENSKTICEVKVQYDDYEYIEDKNNLSDIEIILNASKRFTGQEKNNRRITAKETKQLDPILCIQYDDDTNDYKLVEIYNAELSIIPFNVSEKQNIVNSFDLNRESLSGQIKIPLEEFDILYNEVKQGNSLISILFYTITYNEINYEKAQKLDELIKVKNNITMKDLGRIFTKEKDSISKAIYVTKKEGAFYYSINSIIATSPKINLSNENNDLIYNNFIYDITNRLERIEISSNSTVFELKKFFSIIISVSKTLNCVIFLLLVAIAVIIYK
ncbi:MAG TPA: hypothetical protein VGC17_08265 [Lactovum miscens]|uniref:hypothetical protein n=1 Tax=Lactovum miscens TaxID=190387 RepID=UPI002EDA29C9